MLIIRGTALVLELKTPSEKLVKCHTVMVHLQQVYNLKYEGKVEGFNGISMTF